MNDQSIRNIACAYRKIGQTIEHSIGSYLLKEHSPYNQQHFSQTKILPNETAYYPFFGFACFELMRPKQQAN